MLNTKMSLHDVEDVEALCAWIARNETNLSYSDKEDLLGYLISLCWELSEKYEPQGATITFSTYATSILRHRITDWKRKTFGDTRYGKRPSMSSHEELDMEIPIEEAGFLEVEEEDIPQTLLEELTESAAWALLNVAVPIANGAKPSEVAREHGRSTVWVNQQLQLVQGEMSNAA